MVAQDISLGNDAVVFGGKPGDRVNDAATAEIEAKIIALHTDGKYGVYSSLDRDDPQRADILKGLAPAEQLEPGDRHGRGDRTHGHGSPGLRGPGPLLRPQGR